MAEDLGVGLDIGATRMRVCLGDKAGKIVWRRSRPMSVTESVDDYVSQVVGAVKEAMRRAGRSKLIGGIGVASIGPLDLKGGRMTAPANLPYKYVPLVGPIEEATGLRVSLINDANAAALGESYFGAGRGCENLVYLTISTGIGGGAIVDGNLLSGKDGNAAEVGHVVVDPDGKLTCGCGRKGHWEAYCSGRNIPRLAMLLAGVDSLPDLKGLLGTRVGKVDSAFILASAYAGNRFAKRVSEEMGRLNSYGVANVVNMFDPSLITIGGGVALNNQELVLKPIRELVPKHAINNVPEIRITPLGDDAGLMGALSLAFA